MSAARRIAIGALVLLVLLLALPIAGYFLLDPEDLKARAAAYVKQRTGWELTMSGPVRVLVFPWLGAEMRDVSVRPPDGPAEPLARFEALNLKVRLWPLLSREIRVGGVSAAGGTVRVAANGGAAYELRDLSLETGAFGGAEATDLGLAFRVVGAGEPLEVELRSRMLLDLARETLELSDLRLRAGESSLAGRVRATRLLGASSWDAALTSERLDVDRMLPLFSALSAPPGRQPSRPDRPSAPPAVHATLAIAEVLAYGLRFNDVSATVDSRGGVATVKPARASGYGGSADVSATLDSRRAVPALRATGRLRGVQLQPLLRDLERFQAFSGTADVALDVSARGTGADQIVRTLDGTAEIAIANGRIQGVDFLKILRQARDLLDRLRGREVDAPVSPEDVTVFTRLSASARLADGVARSDDLAVEGPSLGMTGRGAVNLPAETVDFTVRVSSPEVKNTVVPVRITGPLASPRYRLEAGTLLKEEALEELQRQLKRRGLGGLIKIPN